MSATCPVSAIETVEIENISRLFNLTLREAESWIDCLHKILEKQRGEHITLCEFCIYTGFNITALKSAIAIMKG
jgi:hypothetical protein